MNDKRLTYEEIQSKHEDAISDIMKNLKDNKYRSETVCFIDLIIMLNYQNNYLEHRVEELEQMINERR